MPERNLRGQIVLEGSEYTGQVSGGPEGHQLILSQDMDIWHQAWLAAEERGPGVYSMGCVHMYVQPPGTQWSLLGHSGATWDTVQPPGFVGQGEGYRYAHSFRASTLSLDTRPNICVCVSGGCICEGLYMRGMCNCVHMYACVFYVQP